MKLTNIPNNEAIGFQDLKITIVEMWLGHTPLYNNLYSAYPAGETWRRVTA